MKLELKHLAPYLPYGLKLRQETLGNFTSDDNIIKIEKLTLNSVGMCLEKRYRQVSCKPILRPMSDLDRYGLAGEDDYSLLTVLNKKLPKEYNIDRDLDFEIENLSYSNNQYLSARHAFVVYDFLIENHFDVFGLIDTGLAIDINSV